MHEQPNKDLADGPLGTVGQNVLAVGPLGALWIAWVPEGVVLVTLDGEPAPEEVRRRWLPEVEPDAIPERPIPRAVHEPLARYFDGAPVDPATLPVRIAGTKFQRRCWRALRRVPRGRVRTYAGLAAEVGSPRAMRAVGAAMGQNPIPVLVPCHRCVGAGLRLGGYSGGLDNKRLLLELEGVKVVGDRVLPGQLELL